MRSTTLKQDAGIAAPHRTTHLRVQVADADGALQELTDLAGIDWVDEVVIEAREDEPISGAQLTLFRSVAANSLAPLMEGSPLNVDGIGAYAPLLNPGRAVKVWIATLASTAALESGDWTLVFDGTIDTVDWGGSRRKVLVTCRDLAAELHDTIIETVTTRGDDTTPPPIQTVIQDILDAQFGAGVIPLITIGDPDFGIFEYDLGHVSVLEALRALVDQIGWSIRYRWNEAAGAFRLTLSEPERVGAVAVATFTPADYYAVHAVNLDRTGIRNAGEVIYKDVNGDFQTVTGTRAGSIAEFGRRFIRLLEEQSSITTATQATALLNAVLDDLSEPPVAQQIEAAFFWPVELGDVYTYQANGDHYDVDKAWATVGYRHVLSRERRRTFLAARGKPSGGYTRWLRRKGLPDVDPGVAAPTGLVVAAGDAESVITADGVRVARIKMTWTGAAEPFLSHYEVQAKKTADADYDPWGTADKDAELFFVGPVTSASWDVRIRSINTQGDASAWVTASITPSVTPSVLTAASSVLSDTPLVALQFREEDEILPLGLWRWAVAGDAMRLQKNTAGAGDFSTLDEFIRVAATGAVIVGTVTGSPGAGVLAPEIGLHIGSTYTAPPTGGLRTEGQLIVQAGGLSVLAGTTAVQALTATTIDTTDRIIIDHPSNPFVDLRIGGVRKGLTQTTSNFGLDFHAGAGMRHRFVVDDGILAGVTTIEGDWILGATTPATGNPRLDVVGTGTTPAMVLTDVTGDASSKSHTIAGRHVTNTEPPVALVSGRSQAGANVVGYGGSVVGSIPMNAATEHRWFTAADITTLGGTLAADLTGVGTASLWHFRGDIQIASLGRFDGADVPTEGQVLIYKAGAVNKWQAESLNAVWGDTDFKAAILADGAATYIFFDPGAGTDSPAGAPPIPPVPTVTQHHGAHTVEVRGYAKPADFRQFEWEYDKNSAGVWLALATSTSAKVVHSRLPFDGTTFRYRVRVVDRAANASAFTAATAAFTPIRTGETHAFGAIIAGEIAVANLAAITATMGILTSGQIRGPGNTHGINFSGAGGIPGTWVSGINFENTDTSALKMVLDFDDRIFRITDEQVTPQTRIELGEIGVGVADWGLRIRNENGVLLMDAQGSVFQLQDPTATRGINLYGTRPAGWTRYLDAASSDFFIKHERFELKHTGDPLALFKGSLDLLSDDLAAGSGEGGWMKCRLPNLAHGMTDLDATDVAWDIFGQSNTQGGVTMRGYTGTGSTTVVPLLLFGARGLGTTLNAAVHIHGRKKNLTGTQVLADDEPILRVTTDTIEDAAAPFQVFPVGVGGLQLIVENVTIGASTNDLALSDKTVIFRQASGQGAQIVTGIAGGRPGRILIFTNDGGTGATITFNHESTASLAANRIIAFDGTSQVVDGRESVMFWYDSTSSRWRCMSFLGVG